MKITVSAKGKSLDSDIDSSFGQCKGFILFETEDKNTTYLDNSAQRNLVQGTGIKAAQMIAEAGTEVLITGKLGPKAARILSKAGIKIYACSGGTVQEDIRALDQSKLKVLGKDKIQPGPGKMGGRGMGGGGRGRVDSVTGSGPKQGGS